MGLHVGFEALTTKLYHLEVWESKWSRNLGISVGNGWSSKTQGGLGSPFDPQGGWSTKDYKEYYKRGWSPSSLPLKALVSPSDSWVVM